MTDSVWDSILERLEKDLRARISGDSSAIDDAVWIPMAEMIRRYAESLARRAHLDPGTEDEIAQEALIKLQNLDVIRRIRAAGSPEGYVLVMVRNVMVDMLRRRNRALPKEIPLSEGLIAAYEPAPDEAAETERIEALRKALSSLRPSDRIFLRLRFWEGLSIREIAERTGLKYSAVAVRLFRVLSNLRRQLGVER